jgi:predicted ATP pyrophosphatase (TIGR00289 family)
VGLAKALALYSGGKDSHYSLVLSYRNGIIPYVLVTAAPLREDSWLFHGVNVSWCKLHGEAMGIPSFLIEVSGRKNRELNEFKRGLSRVLSLYPDVDYLITGAVRSRYQLEKFKELSEELGLRLIAPLWGADELTLLRRESEELGFVVTAVQAYCLDYGILGNPRTEEVFRSLLKAYRECGISPVGEGGEFETFVIRSPLFRGTSVALSKARKVVYPNMYVGYYIIEHAYLI